MVEFMNLHEWGIIMHKYCLKFTNLSKCATTMVAQPMARMNTFLMIMSSMVEKKCRNAMLFNYMDISRLMVYAQKIE